MKPKFYADNMKVVFFGYRPWALKIGHYLLNKWPFWKLINIVQKENVDILKEIEGIEEGTVLLFYGWSWPVPKEVYEKYICLALHPSPLPKYRGGSPLQHQIMAGEKESAVTIFRINGKIDSGDIYSQTSFPLDGSLSQIFNRIIDIAVPKTVEVLEGIALGKPKFYPQDESEATTYKRRKPEESELTIEDFKTMTATQLNNFIRALADPYPNAFIRDRNGRKLYFTGSKLDETR